MKMIDRRRLTGVLAVALLVSPSPSLAAAAAVVSEPLVLPPPVAIASPAPGSPGFHGKVLTAAGAPAASAHVRLYPDKLASMGRSPCIDEPASRTFAEAHCPRAREALVEAGFTGIANVPPLAETIADAQGKFVLPGTAGAHYLVLAEAGGEVVLSDDVTAPAEVNLKLAVARKMELRVESVIDSKPIAGARVVVVQLLPLISHATVADKAGVARVSGLLPGDVVVIARADGFMPETRRGESGDWKPGQPPIPLELTHHRSVKGRVLDGTSPAAGAKVFVAESPGTLAAKTAPDGTFTLNGVACLNACHLIAQLGSRVGQVALPQKSRERGVEVRLGDAARLAVLFKGAWVPPKAQIIVKLHGENGQWVQLPASFKADTLVPGLYFVDIRSEGAHTLRLFWELAPGENGREVELLPAVDISGTVLDESAHPVKEAFVSRMREGTNQGSGFRIEDDGTFSIEDIEGTYEVTAQAEGYLDAVAAKVHAPASGLRLVLRRGVTISGVVVDGHGRPVPEVELRADTARVITEAYDRLVREHSTDKARLDELERKSDDEIWHHDYHSRSHGHEDGKFTIGGLVQGQYDVEARAPGFVPAKLRTRAPATGVKVTLGSGAVLKIFVLDDAGEPHNGSMVAWARPVGGTFKDDVGADVVDQRDGSCLLESLPEGDWNIRVQGFVKGDAEHPPELGRGRNGVATIELTPMARELRMEVLPLHGRIEVIGERASGDADARSLVAQLRAPLSLVWSCCQASHERPDFLGLRVLVQPFHRAQGIVGSLRRGPRTLQRIAHHLGVALLARAGAENQDGDEHSPAQAGGAVHLRVLGCEFDRGCLLRGHLNGGDERDSVASAVPPHRTTSSRSLATILGTLPTGRDLCAKLGEIYETYRNIAFQVREGLNRAGSAIEALHAAPPGCLRVSASLEGVEQLAALLLGWRVCLLDRGDQGVHPRLQRGWHLGELQRGEGEAP
jgi:hypothetical protein